MSLIKLSIYPKLLYILIIMITQWMLKIEMIYIFETLIKKPWYLISLWLMIMG